MRQHRLQARAQAGADAGLLRLEIEEGDRRHQAVLSAWISGTGGYGLAGGRTVPVVRELRDQRVQQADRDRGIAAAAGRLDGIDGIADRQQVGGARRGHQQPGMAGRHRGLVAVEQLLDQLLARTQAGVADRHVLVRPQPGKPDHLPRQIDDLHQPAHVEHEDAAVAQAGRSAVAQAGCDPGSCRAQHAGLQHQPDRLRHRHEVALHVRVRHRQRTATLELAPEQRHHRAVAAEHVAEPDRHAAHRARRVTFGLALPRPDIERLAVHLGSTLGGAHQAAGIDRLVGRDQHHRPGSRPRGGVGDLPGADDVGQQPLARIQLDHRHMLQRRRMEDQFRPVRLEHAFDAPGVAGIGDHRGAPNVRHRLAELEVDLPEREFAVVDQDQQFGIQRGDLARELGTDAAAGAGHQHAPAAHQPGHAIAIQRHLRPVQQLLDRHRPQLDPRRRGQRGRVGRPAYRDAARIRRLDQGREVLAAKIRLGHHQRARRAAGGGQAVQHRAGIAYGAEDAVAAYAPAGLVGAERQQAEDAEGRGAVTADGAQEQVGRLVGADQQHRLHLLGRQPHPLGLRQPVDDAQATQHEQEHHGVDHREGDARQRVAGDVEQQGEQGGAQHRSTGDAEQVGDAGEAPVLLRHAERCAADQQGDGAAGEEPERMDQAALRIREVARDRRRRRRERAVECHVDEDPVRRAHAGRPAGARWIRRHLGSVGALRGHHRRRIAQPVPA